jgi:hypothetical protein
MKFVRISTGLVAVSTLTLAPSIALAQGRGEAHAARPVAPKSAPAPATKPTSTTIAGRIESHPQLAAKLTPLLPKGMTFETASAGFKNQGQFIAALHVSHNLGISFTDLKAKMTGSTPESLGQAIHDLRPDADEKAESKKATKQAHDDEK